MSRARVIAATVIAVYLLLVFLDRFLLIDLFVRRVAVPTVLVALEALAIVATGALVRRSRSDVITEFLVGYPIFGTLLFLVGLIRVNAIILISIVLIGAMAGALMTWTRVSDWWRAAKSAEAAVLTPRPPGSAAWIAVAVTLGAAFVLAQAPAVSLDELAYHLAVPRTWVNEGRAVELPLLSHSYFPLGIESADLPLIAALGGYDGGIASHLLHFLAAVATTILIARRAKSPLVTAAIVTTPALALTAGWSLVDWPLAGICVALVAALDQDDDAPAIAAAVGAGLLTKYTFIPFALIALILAKRWRAALPGLAIGSVFFVRNLLLTGNPIAPFFSAAAPHVSAYRDIALNDYVFQGAFVDEALGIGLLALCALTVGRIAWALLAAGVALFLLGPSSRILLPFLLVPAISAAAALRSRTVRVLISIAVALQTFYVVWFVAGNGAFDLLSGRASEKEYVTRQRASFASIEWLDLILPAESRTLVVGMNETYWFEHRVRGGGNFDGERMSRYLTAQSPEALRERLRRDGISHVAVLAVAPPTGDATKVAERRTALTTDAQRALALLLDRYAAQVIRQGDATLFTLQ